MSVDVIPPGTRVTIGGDVPGTVLSIGIRTGPVVQYEVVWWDRRVRQVQWLDPLEIVPDPADSPSLRVGFRA